ncbi:glycosyltransferase involved in cell wall biosynthesis [Vibrio crassostreae]|uniref:hypothetical protein n=1 Tax=Vibrio crassostreae TaxID=246167 RepID=UPI001052390F|nr:hypothetical protein [Vibrio crassostreae]TCN76740.1 glycosyltransferase involved in cell wall biosynthesis [Vibrio crassostreae]TWD36546.1 glycosyltransferase involved in cell wall biosynthesis [Vibrio crassostreae]TWD66924.1 glycosyltransferase involved in cell wall biosynthesis [Vibrio crassostreae]
MNLLFVCDHHLDPRLVKRKSWIEKKVSKCTVYVDKTRGGHFSNQGIEELDLKSLKISDIINNDKIYISGGRVIISHALYFALARLLKKDVVYEIPDLPLREKSEIKNRLIGFFFSSLVSILFKRVVITSEAFKRKLPKNIDYFECENLPNHPKFIEKKETNNKKINISFVGVIRYIPQMKMLIKYASLRNIKVNFYGGPEGPISELKQYINSFRDDIDVNFYGRFIQSDLDDIYSVTDFVYSVYDVSQENVRLALPNKLYESTLYRTPIIVANNTYLGEVVDKEGSGFSVCSRKFSLFCEQMDSGLKNQYEFSTDILNEKIKNQENEFMTWFNNCQG